MKTTRRKFTPEYKLRALDLMNELGATQAAEKLGLNDSTLYNWKKNFLKKGENDRPGPKFCAVVGTNIVFRLPRPPNAGRIRISLMKRG